MSNTNKAPFVLVHGGWHGGWCWEKVAPLLQRAGREVYTIDLPGMGEDQTPIMEATLDTYVNAVKILVEKIGELVILVGHSMGGVVINQTAELIPERIHTLGYLSAFSPKDGESLYDYAAIDSGSLVTRCIQLYEEEGYYMVEPDRISECFYGMCSDADIQNAVARLRKQSLDPATKPLKLSDENYGRVRRCYIECTEDKALSLPMQRVAQSNGELDRVFTLESDHSPFYSCPERLVECLLQI